MSPMQNYSTLNDGEIEIMSVDDDPINQMVIENLLQPCGYKLTLCMDGVQCLERIAMRGFIPDLMLLDVMMPHLNGYEVCSRLRALHGTIALPILMVSAKNDHESVVKCFEAGGNDFVHKPFHREELLSRIKMQLNSKALWRLQIEQELSKSYMSTMMPKHVVERLHKFAHTRTCMHLYRCTRAHTFEKSASPKDCTINSHACMYAQDG